MGRVTMAMIAEAAKREAGEGVSVGDADIPQHYVKKPVAKKPAGKKRSKAKKRA